MAAGKNSLYRILDANSNRAKEGLRVCEDICRYIWDDASLTRALKNARHGLARALEPHFLSALAHRNIGVDVGRETSVSESQRKNVAAVFWANAQRVKESLRVMEEITKIKDRRTAQSIKTLRYKFYALEQKALKKR